MISSILQNALDEMERKKERIMLLSLQRRQQQEEMKQHKEQESQRRREMEKLKQEERERKKEEERLRRAAILEQYKLKKAIEEAEREVCELSLIIKHKHTLHSMAYVIDKDW
jgi:calmodulin-regulated spectrin-associated protein